MKTTVKTSKWLRITLVVAVLFVALGLLRKPLLIAFHRHMMVTIWQTEMDISEEPTGLDLRLPLGLSAARKPNPRAAVRAFPHREALVRLGYFTKQRFALQPVTVGTAEYQKLFDMVLATSGQEPIAQFEDDSAEPRRVVGLIVYATPNDMPRWEQVITTIKGPAE